MTTMNGTVPPADAAYDPSHDYHALNAMLNLYDAQGRIQFDKDKAAEREYVTGHVAANTIAFPTTRQRLDYLIRNNYYDGAVFDRYSPEFLDRFYAHVESSGFEFGTFLGAFKFYASYALKTFDGTRYLEDFPQRAAAVALALAAGDEQMATRVADEIIAGRFQPATPTFLNLGKAQRGEPVSCFLIRIEDNMESISRGINAALQLSKRGGGVALLLSNLRELGAPIKQIEHQSSGVVPVMKLLEDSFSYANQLGARQGAGAVYLNAHHPDILRFLDTKRENADEKIRIKSLALGVVVPDITFELAKRKERMALFSPYDVERVYGKPFADISVTEEYDCMVGDERISDALPGRDSTLPQEVRRAVREAAKTHAKDILDQLRELGVDLRTNPAIFIGGGSSLFRPLLEGSPMVAKADFVEDPKANAIGYEMLAAHQLRS